MTGIRVIVVEDNADLRDELEFQLQAAGFKVRGAPDGPALDALWSRERCDVLVLDINLPGEDGYSIARRFFDPQRLCIIMLTARDAIDDKTRGFADGADSYLVKPVDRRELAACIRALYRRVAPPEADALQWMLHAPARELVAPDGRKLHLTGTDVTVLSMLTAQPGAIKGRSELAAALGIGYMETPDGRTNTIISRLRQKLSGFAPELRVLSWRNQGYSYVGPSIQLLPGRTRAAD